MPRKRHTPEQIIGKLREAEVARRVVERCSKCAGPWASPSRLGDELLDGEIFYSLKEAEVLIERWRHHYDTVRPHSALGYRPPAPQAIALRRTDPAFATAGLQPDRPFPKTVPRLT